MDLAKQAETNEMFFEVVPDYYTLIGAYLPEGELLWYALDSLRHDAKGLSDIPWIRRWEARHWVKLLRESFVHTPFQIVCGGEDYFTTELVFLGQTYPDGLSDCRRQRDVLSVI